MPKCRKCNSVFSNWKHIDGKYRNLSSRKYCLKCSPFKKNNRKTLEFRTHKKGVSSKCETCDKEYVYKKGTGHTLHNCNSCNSNKYRKACKKRGVDYLGGKCKKCGYNRCIKALDFHHTNPKEKEFVMSNGFCYKWEKVRVELDKCDLLCSNCHRELHDGHK